MKVVYIANDGTEFDDQFECEVYEASSLHDSLIYIDFYDGDGKTYHIDPNNIFDETVYWKSEKIIIPRGKAYDDFAWLTEETGWCEWEDITEPGIWTRHEDELGNAKWRKQ